MTINGIIWDSGRNAMFMTNQHNLESDVYKSGDPVAIFLSLFYKLATKLLFQWTFPEFSKNYPLVTMFPIKISYI